MAPTDAGTTCLTKAEDALVDMLADLAEFRAWAQKVDAAAAKTRIFVDYVPGTASNVSAYPPAEYAALFPNVLIYPPEGEAQIEYESDSVSNGPQHIVSAVRFGLQFCTFAQQGLDEQDIVRRFKNQVGAVHEALLSASSAAGAFWVSGLAAIGPRMAQDSARPTLGWFLNWDCMAEYTVPVGGGEA